jgi:hypothetical protein
VGRRGRYWTRGFGTLIVALTVTAVVAVGAQAQAGDGARAEREQVRGQRAQVALQVNALQADNATLDQATRDIEDNLRFQQALQADAQRAADQAVQEAIDAQAAADAKAVELDALEARMQQFAVNAYVDPPGNDLLDRLKADNANDAAQKQALLDLSASRDGDVVDQLRAARVAYQQERERADQARADAEARQREAQQRTIDLQQAKSAQAQFASQLEERLNAKLAEANALASADARLSVTIAAEQADLIRRLRDLAPPPPRDQGGSPSTPPPSVAPVPLATVRGITVNKSIAKQLDSLLAAASADGIALSGTGYRDPAQQIELRKQHCGTSYYEIYVMPPYLCTPPTAIPGSSMHEQGLAVDFTWKGASLTNQDNAAFTWLSANAATFGFYNLPSEPWHWSVSGK